MRADAAWKARIQAAPTIATRTSRRLPGVPRRGGFFGRAGELLLERESGG